MLSEAVQVDVCHLDGVVVMRVQGEIDRASAPGVRAALDEIEANQFVTLDCTLVDFMDSTGLNLFVGFRSRVHEHHGSVRILPSSVIRRLIEVAGLAGVFELEAA